MISGKTGFWEMLRRAGKLSIDLILPPQCPCCDQHLLENGAICPACWSGLDLICEPRCDVSGLPFSYDPGGGARSPAVLADPPEYDRARFAARFDGVARELVHLLKYRDRLEVSRPLGVLMAHAGTDLLREADFVVPVPLYPMRLWRRRFNQSALLANSVADRTGISVRHNILRRVRPTRPQVGLTANQRRHNVSGAFSIADAVRQDVAGRHIVLIDDVITTGATVNACAQALRAGCAEGVDVLAFARVVEQA